MKSGTFIVCVVALLAGAPAMGQTPNSTPVIHVMPSASMPSNSGPAETFTGAVRVAPLFQPEGPSRSSAGGVTFQPGARTAWHTHPAGQTLVVTSGAGRVQQWGGVVQEIKPGDVVRIPPGVKHWHGAGPSIAMSHIAIQETVDGRAVDWMEKVSDAQYAIAPAASH